MSTNETLYGTKLHSNGFLIAPMVALDIPIYDPLNPDTFPDYHIKDEFDVVVGGMTINQFIAQTPNRKYFVSEDGLNFKWGMNFGYNDNSKEALDNILTGASLVLTTDFTDMATNVYWVASVPEVNEWTAVSPHNNVT